ncbi:MAG: ABC transporter permease [Nocardioidaceae bacterium]
MSTNITQGTALVFTRELRPVIRDPFSVLFGLIQPLFFLALFAPLLSSVSGLGASSSLQWFVPGVVVMLCLFGTSTTGANLQFEMQTGSHERLLVTPLSRSSLMIGRALKEIVPTVAQAVVIVLATLLFGFRADVVGVATGLVILAVFCVGLGALSYSLALACKNQEWMFWVVQQTLLFPLLLLAGMLLPIDNGPGWLQALSRANPLTYVVDAERALFNGDFSSDTLVGGVLAALVMATLGLWVGTRSMRASD